MLRQGTQLQLLATVSAIALLGGSGVLISTAPAQADQVSFPSGFWVSVEGKYLFAGGTGQQVIAPTVFAPGPLSPSVGGQSDRIHNAYSWEVAVGAPIPPQIGLPSWDFRFAYTGIRSQHQGKSIHATVTGSTLGPASSTVNFSSNIKQTFDIGDFDIGHDYGLGGVQGRAFLGARFVSFNQRTSAALGSSFFGGEGSETACSHFFGGGPRIGYDGSYPLTTMGPVAVSATGNIATAALFGSSSHRYAIMPSPALTSTQIATNDQTGLTPVVNGEVSLGLAFAVPFYGTMAKVGVGYGAQAWINILDTVAQNEFLAGTAGTRRGDQFFHGPFLNVSMKW